MGAGWTTECCQEQVLRRRDAVQVVNHAIDAVLSQHTRMCERRVGDIL